MVERHHPDDPLERLLSRQLRDSPRAEDTAEVCPEVELIAAYAEGGLSGTERASLETHLGGCGRCTHVLALSAAAEEAAPAGAASGRAGSLAAVWRFLAPAAAAAAGVAIWFAIDTPRRDVVEEAPVALSAPAPAPAPLEDAASTPPSSALDRADDTAQTRRLAEPDAPAAVAGPPVPPTAAARAAAPRQARTASAVPPATAVDGSDAQKAVAEAAQALIPEELRPEAPARPSFRETVAVQGTPPTVDVQNARQQQVFTGDDLRELPTTRNQDLLGLEQGRIAVDALQVQGARGDGPPDTVQAEAQETTATLSGRLGESETGGAAITIVPDVSARPAVADGRGDAPGAAAKPQPATETTAERTRAEAASGSAAGRGGRGGGRGGAVGAGGRGAAAAGRATQGSPPSTAGSNKDAPIEFRFSAEAPTAPTVFVATADPNVLWRVRGRAIERSLNGGMVWTLVHTAAASMTAGVAPSPDVAWFYSVSGLVVRFTPAGWQTSSAPPGSPIVSLEPRDALRASIVLADGRAFATADGGTTWTPR